MTRRKRCKMRIKLPLVTLFWLTFLLSADGTGVLRISLLCAVLHETGHLLAYHHLVDRWPALELSPTGICLSLRGVFLTTGQELLLASAGPLANLLCCSLTILLMRGPMGYSYAGYWFASANLLVGGANLLPLPGLDGARILQSLWDGLHSRQK